MYKTILLTGIPRSGSTLICNLLNSYENTIALLEPMDVMSINPKNGNIDACENINNFIFESRKNIIYNHKIMTKHQNGIVPMNPLGNRINTDDLRKVVVKSGEIEINDVSKDFTLIVKHNAFYTSILKDLNNFFQCYGIIRNPLSVLASWSTVDLPINNGHIPAGERFDSILKNKLNNIVNVLDRQLIILDWFFNSFDKNLDLSHIIKYENIIRNPDILLKPLSYNGVLKQKHKSLYNKNSNSQYKDIDIKTLFDKLMQSQGAYWNYYEKSDIEKVYKQLCRYKEI